MNISEQFRQFRRVSTPLVAVCTSDQRATIKLLSAVRVNEEEPDPPVIVWDLIGGHRGVNDSGVVAAGLLGDPTETANSPVMVLKRADQLPEGAMLFVLNAHRFLDNVAVEQAVWNLRDEFKRNRRTLVLLAPLLTLPASLHGDVFQLTDPLPGSERIQQIIADVFYSAELEPPADLAQPVAALRGLSSFAAEEATAHCLRRDGLDMDGLWQAKRRMIDDVPGLAVWSGAERFRDIGGVDQVKHFLRQVSVHGKQPPNCVVFIDEIEKAMAGSDGDLSGVAQDCLGTLLAYMQDQQAQGCIFLGPPGSAKSMVAKATGSEAAVPTIQLDLGGLRGSLVGQSETQLRTALQVVTAVSNGNSLWIATCNQIGSLKPELRRRFNLGTFFFDLPDATERDSIWQLYQDKYQLSGAVPNDDGWTGAEIKQCSDLAWRLNVTLQEAASFIVPVSRSAAEEIDQLRTQADGKYLSASYPGVYRKQRKPDARAIAI